MLGYWIVVSAHRTEAPDVETDQGRVVLATWETGVDGLFWLKALVQEGKATQLSAHGYPNRYRSTADVVLPMITSDGIKPANPGNLKLGQEVGRGYMRSFGWISEVDIRTENIRHCVRDTPLTIDAWDLS